jgi:hypothetical protein
MQKIFIVLFVIIALLAGGIYAIPESWKVERELWIAQAPNKIYPYLVNLRKWKEWSSQGMAEDEQVEITYQGPAEGIGAIQEWKSKTHDVGGSIKIIDVQQNQKVAYEISMGANEPRMKAQVLILPENNGAKVTGSAEGHNGWNPKNRLLSLFLDNFIGGDFEKGLQQLKIKVEKDS